jgi:hypothetical protein
MPVVMVNSPDCRATAGKARASGAMSQILRFSRIANLIQAKLAQIVVLWCRTEIVVMNQRVAGRNSLLY